MEKLSSNWFVEGLQDFEYKKYLLLAYLQWVKACFDQSRLYPAFSDLIGHHHNLVSFRDSKEKMQDLFPKTLSGIDLSKLQLLCDALLEDDSAMKEIEDIVAYSIPMVRRKLERGKDLYEKIEEQIRIETVGLLPLYKDEGYLLLQVGRSSEIKVFSYHLTVFESANERYRGIHTKAVATFNYSISNTFQAIKRDLVRSHRELPNPATFHVYSDLKLPEKETVVPIAKRKFMQHLATIDSVRP